MNGKYPFIPWPLFFMSNVSEKEADYPFGQIYEKSFSSFRREHYDHQSSKTI